jgi:hypothetical protein
VLRLGGGLTPLLDKFVEIFTDLRSIYHPMTDKGDQYIDEMLVAYGLPVPTWDDIPEWVWKAEVGAFPFSFVFFFFFFFCARVSCGCAHAALPSSLTKVCYAQQI